MNLTGRDAAYELRLAECAGTGSLFAEAKAIFGSAAKVFEAGETALRMSGIFSPAKLNNLLSGRQEDFENIVQICVHNSYGIIFYGEEGYPVHLRDISDAPPMLYVSGDAEALKQFVCVAMVGAREASAYGRQVAFRLSASLARADAAIISGGALGIDTASHEGALSEGGRTVAVLGCGLGTKYLTENEPLRQKIKKSGGCLISEYRPFSTPTKMSFPKRNRIISGMSLATIIVEAGEKSGSLGTAKHALKQGKDLCAVPGDLINSGFTGSNLLIANGARAVFCSADVLSDYAVEYPDKIDRAKLEYSLPEKTEPEKAKRERIVAVPSDLTPQQAKVYSMVSEEISYDEIASLSGLNPVSLSETLTLLEIKGLIRPLPGNRYAPA